LLPPLKSKIILGEVKIMKVFEVTIKAGFINKIAGWRVMKGNICRFKPIKILRNRIVI
jgi:hypothetical protein